MDNSSALAVRVVESSVAERSVAPAVSSRKNIDKLRVLEHQDPTQQAAVSKIPRIPGEQHTLISC